MEDLKRSDLVLSLETAMFALGEIYPEFNKFPAHNIDTPRRIADMWIEMFKGLKEPDFIFTVFKNEDKCDTVELNNIEFSSMCMHHFMPFSGTVDIQYTPNKIVCGISKLARAVDYFSARPQVQEKMGEELKDFLMEKLDPLSLTIKITSQHSCVGCRGAKARNSFMVTKHTAIGGQG